MNRAGRNPRRQNERLHPFRCADNAGDRRLEHTAPGSLDKSSHVMLPFDMQSAWSKMASALPVGRLEENRRRRQQILLPPDGVGRPTVHRWRHRACEIVIALAAEAALDECWLEPVGPSRNKRRDACGTCPCGSDVQARVDERRGNTRVISHDTAEMKGLAVWHAVAPAANRLVLVDDDAPGQTPCDTGLLDLSPRRRRVPREFANPIVLFACVKPLRVCRIGITPVAYVHGWLSPFRL